MLFLVIVKSAMQSAGIHSPAGSAASSRLLGRRPGCSGERPAAPPPRASCRPGPPAAADAGEELTQARWSAVGERGREGARTACVGSPYPGAPGKPGACAWPGAPKPGACMPPGWNMPARGAPGRSASLVQPCVTGSQSNLSRRCHAASQRVSLEAGWNAPRLAAEPASAWRRMGSAWPCCSTPR